jgi:hypothetical protein
LITSDFPIVAWSAVLAATAGRGAALAGSLGADVIGVGTEGRSGSLGRDGVVEGWFVGFHMSKKSFRYE